MLDVRGVSKIFPARDARDEDVVALSKVCYTVEQAEFFGMIGPSGCGKSTLLRLMAGLEAPTAGQIVLQGQPIERPRADVLVVWQEFALLDWRTVQGNIEFGLEVNGVGKRERLETAERLMAMAGLSHFRHRYPVELSGGMRQRVGLARALALDPAVLLMDEPFGALDAQTRMIMQEEILRIWGETKKTIVFVTHSLEEAVLLADRIAVMTARPGRIKEIMPVDLPRPRPPEIRASAEFGRIYDRLYHLLRTEVQRALAQEYGLRGVVDGR